RPPAACRRCHQIVPERGFYPSPCPQGLLLACTGNRDDPKPAHGGDHPVWLAFWAAEDGHRRPERGRPLHLWHRLARGVRDCPRGLCGKVEIPVYWGHPL